MNNRREFLKLTGIAGAGLLAGCGTRKLTAGSGTISERVNRTQKFNMSGYAAPALQTVRIGFIGVGNRGAAAVKRISKIEGVEIKAICDLRPEKAEAAKAAIANTIHRPDLYSGAENAWKKMCERNDIDLVYIVTPWKLHTPMAVFAMEHDKHTAVEVPAAETVEECWQLVETSEKTRKHCMMLENCCYDFFELLTLNMARQGFFGEIVHAEGAYLHDLLKENFSKEKYQDMWRLKENYISGNLYPTHGLGPVAQAMNINRGDKMDYLVSVSGNDFMMGAMARDLAAKDSFYQQFADKKGFRGNMNVTTVRTSKGKTIMIQHDVTSPRPYSRLHLISGTKAIAQKYPLPARIATSHLNWLSPQEMKSLEQKYQPAIVKEIGELAKKVGGHGGMDFMMDWRLINCLRKGLPLDIDVYDAASWSAIKPLSESSVANRSNSIDIPDFTGGSWKTNRPADMGI
ncbi:Gfo/Idh/MocA family protein [Pedobacter africanus]|uniref:Tat (Twin-arginine translocation) pathway signal sequence n=1 Tax=Pedobacter africanus TaxID=151894 RepID=A0A1W2DVJ4_9SPHI|nr:Gfo/Idh/MocA family oxidoreductase [Pedobacter africanus]SMD01503.1 Tat (twin-arginine translocation) pathway signal sequence [Pedobacter africanus]